MRGAERASALLVAAVLAVSGCTTEPARDWDEPADYTYEASITVFGPTAGEWRVTVRDHEVAEVEGLDEWSTLEGSGGPENFDTLSQVIERYEQARAAGADAVSLKQERDGRPSQYAVDMDKDAVDDELTMVVTAFTTP
ncbi:DUF6174 domain-containing protein [Demequina sp.]|uniref:DUF6174 domain-containing protein n=1 Tax=Demequina sp. TaxID=2050685 RepID=UPI003A843656